MVHVILMVFILARGITPEAECCRTSSHLIEPVSGIRSLVRSPDPEWQANI